MKSPFWKGQDLVLFCIFFFGTELIKIKHTAVLEKLHWCHHEFIWVNFFRKEALFIMDGIRTGGGQISAHTDIFYSIFNVLTAISLTTDTWCSVSDTLLNPSNFFCINKLQLSNLLNLNIKTKPNWHFTLLHYFTAVFKSSWPSSKLSDWISCRCQLLLLGLEHPV